MSWKDAWSPKFDPTRIQAVLVARKPDMEVKVGQRLDELQSMETLVRGCLADKGVDPMMYGLYYAAAEQMYKNQRKWPGGTFLDLAMAATILRFKTAGLTEGTLEDMAYEVFGYSPPPGP